jgi:hypothetical protein
MARLMLGLALLSATLVVPAQAGSVPLAQVCSVACDTLDPSRAQQETFPVPEKVINGRRVVLHVSDKDSMAWGSIDNGVTNDAVWLDRSWDGGATWEGLLGKASVGPAPEHSCTTWLTRAVTAAG